MGVDLGRVVKKELEEQYNKVESEDSYNCNYDRFVFTKCRNFKPKEVYIKTNLRSSDWQVGFFDADSEIYFDKIVIWSSARFSSIVRNYWWNGKEGEGKMEGYYSLIKSVKELAIRKQHVNDLLDYMEGRYKVRKHQRLHKLDKNIKLKIDSGLEETTVEQLQKYFDNIQCWSVTADLKTVNNIICNCDWYKFKNCKGIMPQKLVINAKLVDKQSLILFEDADDEVHIPEITMNEKGSFASIVRNYWENNKEGDEKRFGEYSLIQYVETLTIRNNPMALKNFANYVAGKYEIEHSDWKYQQLSKAKWKLQQLSKQIKIVVEGPGDAFLPVSRIQSYFIDVAANGRKPKEYLAAWDLWNNPDYKAFVNCFKAYGLVVDPPERCVDAARELVLQNCYNIKGSISSIDSLTIRQRMGINSVVCFHDTNKPVIVENITIQDGGDLCCVLQNAYYSGTDLGFFNLLETAKNLEIKNNEQAAEDLADYIDGKYILHPKWERQALDKDMEIKLSHDNRVFSLDVAKRLRNYFRNVSINYIYMPLKTEYTINQGYKYQYIFINYKDANPHKLVINVKLKDNWSLILLNDINGEVCIPEITIGEYGSFDAIVRNRWHNYKNYINDCYYSLVSHVETLTIQNNPEAVCDLDNYVSGNYKIQQYLQNYLKVQKLSKNIIVRINGINGLDKQINRLRDYFGYIIIDDRKVLGTKRRQAIANIQLDGDKIQQQNIANADRRSAVVRADAEIAETRRRIERARARLRRRRARFQEYLTLTE